MVAMNRENYRFDAGLSLFKCHGRFATSGDDTKEARSKDACLASSF